VSEVKPEVSSFPFPESVSIPYEADSSDSDDSDTWPEGSIAPDPVRESTVPFFEQTKFESIKLSTNFYDDGTRVSRVRIGALPELCRAGETPTKIKPIGPAVCPSAPLKTKEETGAGDVDLDEREMGFLHSMHAKFRKQHEDIMSKNRVRECYIDQVIRCIRKDTVTADGLEADIWKLSLLLGKTEPDQYPGLV